MKKLVLLLALTLTAPLGFLGCAATGTATTWQKEPVPPTYHGYYTNYW
jgi:hypothetical protein